LEKRVGRYGIHGYIEGELNFFLFAMLDLKDIRLRPEWYKTQLGRKGVASTTIDVLLDADISWRALLQEVEMLKATQNEASKKIPTLDGEAKQALLGEMKVISAAKKEKEASLEVAQEAVETILERLPNPPDVAAPDGKDDTENVVVKTVGKKPTFDFEPKEHWEIAEANDLLDTERSAKVSGARFYYLKNELALLQRALMHWAYLEMAKKGYTPFIPPFLTREKAIRGTGYFEKGENYVVNPGEDDLYLIGTSEVPMVSYFAGEVIDDSILPYRCAAYSPCFRKEAGSYGKDMKGILRVHQFEKVEMVVFAKPEDTPKIHEEIREIEEDLMQQMGLPYQVVNVCTGDLGGSATKKYDLEAWLPGQGQYREMTSTSICTDYQARRLNIRYKKEDGSLGFVHILNGTAVSSRPLIAILENFQAEDGSVKIPKVLVPFCGFDTIVARG
jgi:seryl-tRNA synthetase